MVTRATDKRLVAVRVGVCPATHSVRLGLAPRASRRCPWEDEAERWALAAYPVGRRRANAKASRSQWYCPLPECPSCPVPEFRISHGPPMESGCCSGRQEQKYARAATPKQQGLENPRVPRCMPNIGTCTLDRLKGLNGRFAGMSFVQVPVFFE